MKLSADSYESLATVAFARELPSRVERLAFELSSREMIEGSFISRHVVSVRERWCYLNCDFFFSNVNDVYFFITLNSIII